MCIVQFYTHWLCGCLIPEAERTVVKICMKKINMLTLLPQDFRSGCITGAPFCHGNDEEQSTTIKFNCSDDEDDGHGSGTAVWSLDQDDHGDRIRDMGTDDGHDTDSDSSDDRTVIHHGDGLPEKNSLLGTSPRLCECHEVEFERGVNSFWVSELQWLQPRMARCRSETAATAREAVEIVQVCAGRLWQLYRLWKLVHGGDEEFAADDYDGRAVECAALVADDKEVPPGECPTVQLARQARELNYNMLRWSLDELLEPMRETLHPRDMVA